jgi:hypothetical protein
VELGQHAILVLTKLQNKLLKTGLKKEFGMLTTVEERILLEVRRLQIIK